MCFVITGEQVALPPIKLVKPPLKINYKRDKSFLLKSDDENHERFDSVTNLDSFMHMIYDNRKQYPAYLLSYKYSP